MQTGRSLPQGADLTQIVQKMDKPQTCNQEALVLKLILRTLLKLFFLDFFSFLKVLYPCPDKIHKNTISSFDFFILSFSLCLFSRKYSNFCNPKGKIIWLVLLCQEFELCFPPFLIYFYPYSSSI